MLSTPMAPRVGAKTIPMNTHEDVRRMFASPVFSPSDSPGPPKAAATGGDSALATGEESALAAVLRTVLVPLEKQISTVVADVARLEREKAQWMELYAHSEIDFATMVSQSTSEAARAVAEDCDTFAAKVQSHWVAAASRRRDRARTSEAFYAWSTVP